MKDADSFYVPCGLWLAFSAPTAAAGVQFPAQEYARHKLLSSCDQNYLNSIVDGQSEEQFLSLSS